MALSIILSGCVERVARPDATPRLDVVPVSAAMHFCFTGDRVGLRVFDVEDVSIVVRHADGDASGDSATSGSPPLVEARLISEPPAGMPTTVELVPTERRTYDDARGTKWREWRVTPRALSTGTWELVLRRPPAAVDAPAQLLVVGPPVDAFERDCATGLEVGRLNAQLRHEDALGLADEVAPRLGRSLPGCAVTFERAQALSKLGRHDDAVRAAEDGAACLSGHARVFEADTGELIARLKEDAARAATPGGSGS